MASLGELLILGLFSLLSVWFWGLVVKPLKVRIEALPTKDDLLEWARRAPEDQFRGGLQGRDLPAAKEKQKEEGGRPPQAFLEVEIYKEIWPKLVDLNKCLFEMKPLLDPRGDACSDLECRKRFIDEFRRSLASLQETILKYKPFYDEAVYVALEELACHVQAKALVFHLGERPSKEAAWARNKEHLEEVGKRIQKVCDIIRSRIFSAG